MKPLVVSIPSFVPVNGKPYMPYEKANEDIYKLPIKVKEGQAYTRCTLTPTDNLTFVNGICNCLIEGIDEAMSSADKAEDLDLILLMPWLKSVEVDVAKLRDIALKTGSHLLVRTVNPLQGQKIKVKAGDSDIELVPDYYPEVLYFRLFDHSDPGFFNKISPLSFRELIKKTQVDYTSTMAIQNIMAWFSEKAFSPPYPLVYNVSDSIIKVEVEDNKVIVYSPDDLLQFRVDHGHNPQEFGFTPPFVIKRELSLLKKKVYLDRPLLNMKMEEPRCTFTKDELNPVYRVEKEPLPSQYPPLNIIVLTKDSPDRVNNLLTALEMQVYPNTVKVLIGDTGSSKENKDLMLDRIEHSRTKDKFSIELIDAYPYHFASCCNTLAARVVGDDQLLLFLNDDVYLQEDKTMRTAVRTHISRSKDKRGTTGLLLVYPNGTVQHAGQTAVEGLNTQYAIGHRGVLGIVDKFKDNRYVLGNTGAFMLVDNSRFTEVRGFPATMEECFEDFIFNIEMILRGYSNVLCGESYAIHAESTTRKKDASGGERLMRDLNSRVYPYLSKCLSDNETLRKWIPRV